MSRSRLKHLVEAGQVSLAGAPITDPSLKVRPGQCFRLAVPAPVDDTPEPQAMTLAIVYEDEHLLVIDKPAGLVVHPAPGNPDRTLVNALLAHCGESLSGIGGVKRPGIVHRLDKDTSGLIVVAKNELAQARLAADFAARRITRAYHAVVWGVPAPRERRDHGQHRPQPREPQEDGGGALRRQSRGDALPRARDASRIGRRSSSAGSPPGARTRSAFI